jgi:hypothetical protein
LFGNCALGSERKKSNELNNEHKKEVLALIGKKDFYKNTLHHIPENSIHQMLNNLVWLRTLT